MTDRELLELAAKAAGYFIKWGSYIVCDDPIDCRDMPYVKTHQYDEAEWHWNPLEDDGDALRLAVTLGIEFASFNGSKVSRSRVLDMTGSDIFEPHEIDPYSATRRAIVRAAAEIGKEIK